MDGDPAEKLNIKKKRKKMGFLLYLIVYLKGTALFTCIFLRNTINIKINVRFRLKVLISFRFFFKS